MNNNAIDATDDGVLSDSSNDGESNAAANLYATEKCALLVPDNEKSNDIILRRIAHYTDSGSRFQPKYQDNDDNDDDDENDGDNSGSDGKNKKK